jgi:hypothetical protein
MKKITTLLSASFLVAMGIYAYFTPAIAFKRLQAAVAENNISGFSAQTDLNEISSHLRNSMSLQMQDAARSYPSRPDIGKLETLLAPYFNARTEALVTPAYLLREFGAQLSTNPGPFVTHFKDLSTALVRWKSGSKNYEITLTRQGFSWQLATIHLPDAMPRYWNQGTVLQGTYHRGVFQDCCTSGKEITSPYHFIRLESPIEIIDVFGNLFGDVPKYVMTGMQEVQLSGQLQIPTGIAEGDKFEITCKELRFGDNGHYALPVYCVHPEKPRLKQ